LLFRDRERFEREREAGQRVGERVGGERERLRPMAT
jgi:hypothetical protein